MKKVFILAISLITVCSVAHAQDQEQAQAQPNQKYKVGLRWGVEAGYDRITSVAMLYRPFDEGNITGVDFNSQSEYALNGLHVGPTLTLDLHKNVDLHFGLYYQFGQQSYNKYSSSEYDFFISTYRQTQRVEMLTSHALQVPILVEFKWQLGNSGIGMFVQVGPKLDFGLQMTRYNMWTETYALEKKQFGTITETTDYAYGHKSTTTIRTWKDGHEEGKATTDTDHKYPTYYNWFDVKIGIGLGFSYRNLYCAFTYYGGVVNLGHLDTECPTYNYPKDTKYVLYENDMTLAVGFKF